jgi:hypothetical protein
MSGADQTFEPATAEQARLGSLSYGRLSQRHPEFDEARMRELHDFYEGGYALARRASHYLFQLCNESDARYAERLKSAAPLGYFGQVVSQFASDLFAQPLSVMAPADAANPTTPGDPPDDFYKYFEKDADNRGTAFVDLMKEQITTALVQRSAFVCVDVPPAVAATNRAEEESAGGGRYYAYDVSPREVINWEEDDRGGFRWVVVCQREQRQESPYEARDKVRETFRVWVSDGETTTFAEHAFVFSADKPPRPEDTPTVPSEVRRTSFRRVPIVRMLLPKGLWVGNAIGLLQKEHWQRRGELNSAQKRSLVAIPYVGRGSEYGAQGGVTPSETQQDPNRGRDPVGTFNRNGFMEVGSGDVVDFAEPKGHCYELSAKQLDELKDEIFRVVHQMAASVKPSAGSLGRSAQSKQQDGKATALVLRALGHEVRKMALAVYAVIAEARGDDVLWTANGLDNYEVVEREQVLEESTQLDAVNIPSETFRVTHATQVAEKLLTGLDPLTLDQMRQEIKKGIKEKMAAEKVAKDAVQAALLDGDDEGNDGGDGDPPGRNGAPPPKKKSPPDDPRPSA